MYRFLQTQQARGSIVMVALARIQGEGGESLGDALPFQLHNLLATRPEISGKGFQVGKCQILMTFRKRPGSMCPISI